MSSSIHYKFRAIIEPKTLSFEGLSILAADLKREICAKENIKAEAFDLKLANAHTKREYAADEQIPRNSSIIVKRIPKEDGEKLPKIQGVNTGMVQRNDPSSSSSLSMATHIPQSIFNKMSEEERLKHIKDISSSAYDPSTYQKRPSGALTGLPPPTYTCNRCHQPGHWYKNCPQLNQKRTTGIPSQELMETTADDPNALIHPSGKFVIPIIHWKARQLKKNVEGNPIQEKIIPDTILCPQCKHLLKDAVITPCCGISFCADCISQQLLESEERHCPGCNKAQLALDSLVPNTNLRQFIANWEAGSNPAEMQVERVRIGLTPSSNPQIAISTSTATLSPSVNAARPSAQPSVAVPTNPPGIQTPAIAIPTPAIQIPTSFTQPPPNMMMVPPSEILAPPGTISHISTLGSTHLPIMQPILPPIPGVQPMTNIYNQPMEVHNGQFMEAWEAYLNRNDKHSRRERERDYKDRDRKRKRSRDRYRSRSVSEERKRSKRDRRDRSPRRDKDSERSKDRSRERYKKREYDSKDSHRSNRKKESTDENADKEDARKHEKYVSANSSKEAIPKDDIDEEAAIDDALKEVETLNMLNKSDKLDDAEDDSSTMLQDSLLNDEDKKHEIKENVEENRNSSEPENFIESHAEKTPRNRSSDSDRSTQEKSDQEKSERDVEKQNKSDSDNEKNKKEKKSKKHKKEKKHKKDKDETEEERKERKRIKKEKKEKKKREKDKEIEKDRRDKHGERDRRGSDPDREHRKKEDKHKEKDKRDDKSKDTGKYKERSRYHDSRTSRREKESSPKEKSASHKKSESESRHKSQRIAEYKDDSSKVAVIDEKQIRDHFSPPPVLLQNKKITLNI